MQLFQHNSLRIRVAPNKVTSLKTQSLEIYLKRCFPKRFKFRPQEMKYKDINKTRQKYFENQHLFCQGKRMYYSKNVGWGEWKLLVHQEKRLSIHELKRIYRNDKWTRNSQCRNSLATHHTNVRFCLQPAASFSPNRQHNKLLINTLFLLPSKIYVGNRPEPVTTTVVEKYCKPYKGVAQRNEEKRLIDITT